MIAGLLDGERTGRSDPTPRNSNDSERQSLPLATVYIIPAMKILPAGARRGWYLVAEEMEPNFKGLSLVLGEFHCRDIVSLLAPQLFLTSLIMELTGRNFVLG